MRSAIFITFMLVGFCAEAQNIIVNGSFEDIFSCPSSASELGYAQPWNGGEGSPDLMNVCGLNEWGVPVNRGGGQWPRTGNGYAGFATYAVDFIDARETLWQRIGYTLVSGEDYYFEAYVSLKDSFRYANHNIGIVFEDTMINGSSHLECIFQCPPVVENTSANPLTSKTDWIKISGTFTASGGEKYIHIGNLRKDADSEIEFVGGSVGNGPYDWEESGYYIDDVWLSHIDSAHYVGIEEPLAAKAVEVYPNPATDHIILTAKQCIAHVQLYDLSGREVAATVGNTTTLQLDVRTLHSGLYVLHGTYANGQRFVTRIVKE